ncbi:MAG: PA14 domain-containing protein [Luteolibacter sp.]|uniref:PA14 domain-containing protein n=1 Tax=Luteolibacter sp. TaxID=1962973 RepID=UPI00326305C7
MRLLSDFCRLSSLSLGAVLLLAVAMPASAALPAGWTDVNIGGPSPTGTGEFDSGTGVWTITGGGTDIGGTADQFNFAEQSVTGNAVAIARVTVVEATNTAAKAGLMFRDSTAAGSPFASVMVTPSSGVLFQSRATPGGTASSSKLTGIGAPKWVKLTRMGNLFCAFFSADGVSWTQINRPQTVAMASPALVGLAVTSHVSGTLNTSNFSNVSVLPNAAPTVAVAPSASPATFTDTRTLLSASGADDGEGKNLTYTWATTGTPPAPVSFVANGTNATKRATVLFTASGTYAFHVTVADAGGLSVVSGDVSVNVTMPASTDMPQYHNTFTSDGVNARETLLTPSSVNTTQFQKQFSTPVDGQIYAQPLYVGGVNITGGNQPGIHNTVYVATEHNSVYAIDSNGGNILWRTTLLDTVNPLVNLLGTDTIIPMPQGESGSADLGPEIGITSTPVIDVAQGFLYVLTKSKQTKTGVTGAHFVQTLFKISSQSGLVLDSAIVADTLYANGIYTYRTTDTGTGTDPYTVGNGLGNGAGSILVGGENRVYFNAMREFNRCGLVLANGSIYIASASHGDNGPYHGWVLRHDAATLDLTGALNASPNGSGAGIWMSGGVPAIDEVGDLYVVTGNGTFDGQNNGTGLDAQGFPNKSNYGDCFMRLTDDPYSGITNQNANGWGMRVADYFSPLNNHDIDGRDADLGSGGVVLLPDSAGSTVHPKLAVGGGKDGTFYLLDRANMGKFDPTTDHIVQEWGKTATTGINGVVNTPAFFNGTLFAFPGYGGDGRAYSISNAAFSSAYTSHTTDNMGALDGTVSISANGTNNGIAWVLDRGASELRAYTAGNLANRLWTSATAAANRDKLPGAVTKFAVPTVADGQVFAGTSGTGASGFLAVYGPPVPPTAGPAAPSGMAAVAVAFNQVTLSWVDNSSNEDSFLVERSSNGGSNWTQIVNASANASDYTDFTTLATTSYQYRVRSHNAFNTNSYSAYSNVAGITTPQAPPNGNGDGAAAAYFMDVGGVHLSGSPALTRVDPTINFDWGNTSPGAPIGIDTYSVRWTGKIQAQYSQTYTFYTNSDDGVRLTVNGVVLVDNWTNHGNTENSGTITLSAGQQYAFVMDYYEDVGGAVAKLSWESASTVKQAIPQAQIYSGTAPGAPTNLTLTAAASTQLNLNWQDHSSNETGFDVERKAGSGGTYAVVGSVLPNVTTFADSGLVPNTDYYYRVTATNFASNSTYSNEAHLLTPVPPLTPTGAYPSSNTTTSVHLAWTDNADNEDNYRILRAAPEQTFIVIAPSLPPNTVAFDNTGLTPGTEYDFHIIASNIAGYSDFAGISTATLTVPPADLVAAGGAHQISLNWTPPSYNGDAADLTFNVYRGISPGGENSTPMATNLTDPGFTDIGVIDQQTYFYKVTAVDPGGESAVSNEASAFSLPGEGLYISSVAGANGSISPSGLASVTAGSSRSYTMTANSGYHVLNVLVDGNSVGAVSAYTFTNIQANHTISASFAADAITYTLTSSAGANGSISPSGATSVTQGNSQSYSITPSTGYHVVNVLVDGNPIGPVTGYTFSNVQANHSISASFAINTYTLTASVGTNGSISPNGTTVVNSGANQSYTLTPASGYYISNVLVDGSPVGAVGSYTFTNVTANHSISASFDSLTTRLYLDFAPSNGVTTNGWTPVYATLQQDTSVNVPNVGGSSLGFTFAHVAAYDKASATQPLTRGGFYTYGNSGNTHPFALTGLIPGQSVILYACSAWDGTGAGGYVVFGNSGAGGVKGQAIGDPGTSPTLANLTTIGTATADATGVVSGALYGRDKITTGYAEGQVGAFVFEIQAPPIRSITASAGANGSISPSGVVGVTSGNSQNFTFTASSGYHVADVLVDGVSVGALSGYTFTNVVASHTISASFAVDTVSHTITATAGANGSISPSGATSVFQGVNQAFAIAPATGYHVANVLVDGNPVGPVSSYLFTSVTAGHTISASFAIDTFMITASAGSNGSISPNGATSVGYGGTQGFTLTPASGYQVVDVQVDGSSVGPVGSYTFSNVTAPHTISASFDNRARLYIDFAKTDGASGTGYVSGWSPAFAGQQQDTMINITNIGLSGYDFTFTHVASYDNGDTAQPLTRSGFYTFGNNANTHPFTLAGLNSGQVVSLYACAAWDGNNNGGYVVFGDSGAGGVKAQTIGNPGTNPTQANLTMIGTATADANGMVAGTLNGAGGVGAANEGQVGGFVFVIEASVSSPDADGDGMTDAWEMTYFGNTNQTATGDFDNDGTNNLTEFRLGLIPNSGTSMFAAVRSTAGVIQWPSAVGVTFTIERSTDLAASWQVLNSSFPGTAGMASFTDTVPPAGKAFYRIKLNP